MRRPGIALLTVLLSCCTACLLRGQPVAPQHPLKLAILLDNSLSMTRCGPNGAYSVFSRASQCIAQIISEWDKEGLIPPGSKIEVYGVSDPDLSRLLGKSQRKPFREPLFKYGAAPQDYKMLRQG